MVPSVGRIVHYQLTEPNAAQINRRRSDAGWRPGDNDSSYTGWQEHVGNSAEWGHIYPLLITRVWADPPQEDSPVNGQVFLDGNDVLWVTSVHQGEGFGHWREAPRV